VRGESFFFFFKEYNIPLNNYSVTQGFIKNIGKLIWVGFCSFYFFLDFYYIYIHVYKRNSIKCLLLVL